MVSHAEFLRKVTLDDTLVESLRTDWPSLYLDKNQFSASFPKSRGSLFTKQETKNPPGGGLRTFNEET